MQPRYAIFIDDIRFNATLFAKRPVIIGSAWDMYELVEKWMEANEDTLREMPIARLRDAANRYYVQIVDNYEGDEVKGYVYIQPTKPADADEFHFLGCRNSIEYSYALSRRGGDGWWMIKDVKDAKPKDAKGRGIELIEYTTAKRSDYVPDRFCAARLIYVPDEFYAAARLLDKSLK